MADVDDSPYPAVMPTMIERFLALWRAWHTGYTLTPAQRAAWVGVSWQLPPAYRLTQPGRPQQARRTWRRAMRVYLQERVSDR